MALTMLHSVAPLSRASSIAASVSTVSPLWVMARTAVLLVDDRVAVAVLAAVIDLDVEPRQLLDVELADQRAEIARAAGDVTIR